jgi:thiol-disulfide isomerase/thioredoxin
MAETDPAPTAPLPTPESEAIARASAPLRQGKWLLLAVIGAALVALLWPRAAERQAAGGFLVDGLGRPAPLAAQLAPVTLLHFYASWCPPCRDEAPYLRRLRNDLANEPRFKVVLVAVEDDVQKAQQLAQSDSVLYDPQWNIAHRYGTSQLPETYLLVGGKVTRKFVGAVDWDDPTIRQSVQRAIAGAR